MRATDLTWECSAPQRAFLAANARSSLFVGGVGSGKTWIGGRRAAKRAVSTPGLGLIAANTYKQLHTATLPSFWRALSEFEMRKGVDWVYNRDPGRIIDVSRLQIQSGYDEVWTSRWGGQVLCSSLTNYEALQGDEFDWIWVDEARDAKREAWDVLCDRLRGRRTSEKQQAWITTTPNGFDWLYDYFGDPAVAGDPERFHVRATTADNFALTPEYVDSLIKQYPPRLLQQQLLGLWVNIHQGRAYPEFDETVHTNDAVTYDPRWHVDMCVDFNRNPMCWVLTQTRRGKDEREQAEVLSIFDEQIIDVDTTTRESARAMVARLAKWGINPASVTVYGDSSGHSGNTKAVSASVSDYTILAEFGFKRQSIPPANPPVKDRVDAVCAKLISGDRPAQVGVRIHSLRCKHTIRDFQQVSWRGNTGDLDKSDPTRTHSTDAVGYKIARLWPMVRVHKPYRAQRGY